MIARQLVRLLAGTANGAGNWPPGLRPNNKGKLSRSAAAPKRRSGLENGRSSSVRAEAVRLRPLVPNEDTSLVSVVLLPCNQRSSWEDVRKLMRQGTSTSLGVRGDCRSVSHSTAQAHNSSSYSNRRFRIVERSLLSPTRVWSRGILTCNS